MTGHLRYLSLQETQPLGPMIMASHLLLPTQAANASQQRWGLTLRQMKGRTVVRGCLEVRQASPMISSTTTCLGLAYPSDRAVATLDPGCTTWKWCGDSCTPRLIQEWAGMA